MRTRKRNMDGEDEEWWFTFRLREVMRIRKRNVDRRGW
jgi:hypothetical protein